MRVLVTGGSGMLGKILTQLLSSTHEVTGVSKSGNQQTLAYDLTDEKAVKKLFSAKPFDLVIHTAAYSDVDGCERDPKLAHESNALATKYLAESCRTARAPFIYVSTDYVFDGKKKSLYSENDPPCPIQVYGMTKLEGEYYAGTVPVSAIVRTSWLFGPESPSNFVNMIVQRLRGEKAVKVLADQEDSPTYVKDLVLALQKIGEHLVAFSKKNPKADAHELFQVCNTGITTRFEMTEKIKELLRLKDVQVEKLDKMPLDSRPALRPRFVAMSTVRYENFFKVKLRPWRDSLKDYLLSDV